MTLTAMRPQEGLSKGREVSLLSVSQASLLISALRAVKIGAEPEINAAIYEKYAQNQTKKPAWRKRNSLITT